MKYDISEDSAKEQLDGFLEYYGIDPDYMGEKEADIIDMVTPRLLSAIRRGRLVIETADAGITVTQNTGRGENAKALDYAELSGKAKIEMDKGGKKNNADGDHARLYRLMGSLCGEGPTAMKALKANDLSVMEALGTLFLTI